MKQRVLIAGAGPAGLTAALEILRKSDMEVIIFEPLDDVGGISRTINYKGNRMDIGGHRFFSKSEWVMRWWQDMMPVAPETDSAGISKIPKNDRHLLVRSRLSRIYYLRKFFDYPISLSAKTMRSLGLLRLVRIGASYVLTRFFPRKTERNLEDFFVNRFGVELYRTFFKDYTEKVWGVSCTEISPDWGAQRIKGLSITKALAHAVLKAVTPSKRDVAQRNTETSLIERFLYPKFGPGQMWQFAADEVRTRGGRICHGHKVVGIQHDNSRVTSLRVQTPSGSVEDWSCDHFISTMPIIDLIGGLTPPAPTIVGTVAQGLKYRDFMTIGLLVRKLKPMQDSVAPLNLIPDTWIYIQEPDVNIGRLQIFNNWSPSMVKAEGAVWLGLEYFCEEGDALWSMTDGAFSQLAIEELTTIGLINAEDVMDSHVVRVPKAYPAYFGTYKDFDTIKDYVLGIENLHLAGRNGMHRYNNQDHSMLTARCAATAILSGNRGDREAAWSVNTEDEYHETSRSPS